ncbi:putative solute/DNA competence effector [Actinobacillus minor NM305]|uniref:RNA chaperone ProQ n=1 Tax=Actinobacillus minor NM305 TaxID=637911 RepID=C5RZ36_9PAST|nr:RNA chaperone ProQ [Actinobacillus minor]EER48059.1 putative solute/DNA competence effector [Actinobacillus minor NM305]
MSEQQLDAQIETSEASTQPSANKVNPPIKEVIAYLAEKFPLCFITEGEVKPLKIGLFQDLAEALADDEKVSKTQLRQVLRAYTMSWRYLASCKPNAVRVGLQGEEAGIVNEQQAEHAAIALAQAKEAFEARKAEQRKAQRKEFFKKQREEGKSASQHKAKKAFVKKKVADAPKATAESLAALANKFSR